MGFIKGEDFLNQYFRINKDIKELSKRKNEDFKFNIFIFYCNYIDSICTEHILHFHKHIKRDVNIYSYGIEKKEDIINLFNKYDNLYSKNKDYYRDKFYQVILIGIGSHLNTDMTIYETIENYFSKLIKSNYLSYLKFFVIDNKRPFNEIFENNDKWYLILNEKEYIDVINILNSKDKKKNRIIDYYNIVKEENKCMSLMIYPFVQTNNEDETSAIIYISSIALISYLKTDQITYDYYNKEIKTLYNDSLNISSGNYMQFEEERGLLPMLSFLSLNESLEIDERIYIYDHKNIKNTFNQIRTLCHIEIKEFTGNFRQMDLKKQNEILRKLKTIIKIIKSLHTLGWKRRTYILHNSDSFYFLLILIYIYINRAKKIDTYLYNCLKASDFLHNVFKDRLKQSEIYDKLIEKHLFKNASNYLSILIKKVIDCSKKKIPITSYFKIYLDTFQTIKNTYSHPYELKYIGSVLSAFQSHGIDKYKSYHLIVCNIIDSENTYLHGFAPFNKKDYWPFIFSKVAYSNLEQVTFDTITDTNTILIRKNDLNFILDEIKDIFSSIIRHEKKKEMMGNNEDFEYSEEEMEELDEMTEDNTNENNKNEENNKNDELIENEENNENDENDDLNENVK